MKYKKKKNNIIFGIVTLVVFLVMLAFGKFFVSDDDNSDSSVTSHDSVKFTEIVSEAVISAQSEDTAGSDELSESGVPAETITEIISEREEKIYCFRNSSLKKQHYEKHGKEMGFSSADEYERAASDVINSSDALHKKEAEDNDDIFYIEATNDFVVVSVDGYLRTYFRPDKGKAYYDRQ